MNYANCCRLGCVLLLLCGACGDDDAATTDSPSTGQERDGGADDDGASADDAPSDAGGGSDPGSEPKETDAATPPPEQTADAGTPDESSDAAVASDGAVEVTDCESLSACCEQLRAEPRKACKDAIEMADDAACVEMARVECSGAGDGGMPAAMACEELLECCTALEAPQQTACEAAAAAPAGRACDRAVEMYCQ